MLLPACSTRRSYTTIEHNLCHCWNVLNANNFPQSGVSCVVEPEMLVMILIPGVMLTVSR